MDEMKNTKRPKSVDEAMAVFYAFAKQPQQGPIQEIMLEKAVKTIMRIYVRPEQKKQKAKSG